MNIYAWPLRPTERLWLVGMAVLAAVFDLVGSLGGLVATVLGLTWWMLAFKLASESLARAAAGRDDDSGYEVFAADGMALRQLLLALLLFVIGSGASKYAPPAVFYAFCALAAVMLPATILLIVMEDDMVRALDPRLWFELLRRIGGEYLGLALQLAALAAAIVLLIRGVASALPSVLGEALAHGLFLYLLLVAYHALGALLHRRRDVLEMEEATPPSRRHLAQTPEEIAAVAEATRLLEGGQRAEAAGVLDRLIRGRGATAPVHRHYRELLTALGDEAGLQRHARDYVAVLLHLRQEREALALYLDAKRRDADFQLADPQAISDLLAIAARNQQSQLAVSLYEEFARRFPRDRDLVANGLSAAQLMDRLDRDADARQLLQNLLQRFPEHALAPQLQAALDGLRR